MDKLVEYLVEGFKELKILNILIIFFWFILSVLLLITSIYLRENSEYASALLNAGMFLFWITFMFFLLYLSNKWKEYKKNIKKEIMNILEIIKDLQEKFEKIDFLESCEVNDEVKFWKDIFKVKNNSKVTIVCAINEETWNIENFYIRSSSKDIRDKILNYKSTDKEYNKKLWYNFTHLVYKDTEDMCKDWKYEEAIKFLIDILEKGKIVNK